MHGPSAAVSRSWWGAVGVQAADRAGQWLTDTCRILVDNAVREQGMLRPVRVDGWAVNAFCSRRVD